MIGHSKPLYEVEKQLQYRRHKNRLQSISQDKPPQNPRDTIEEMHRIRNQSLSFQHTRLQQKISHQNEHLLNKLLDISKRKQSVYSTVCAPPKMVIYNNPLRKRWQRQVTQTNQMLAERMLTQQSSLDYKSLRKSVEEHDKIKRNLANVKKLSSNFLPLLAQAPLKQSKVNGERSESHGGSRAKKEQSSRNLTHIIIEENPEQEI